MAKSREILGVAPFSRRSRQTARRKRILRDKLRRTQDRVRMRVSHFYIYQTSPRRHEVIRGVSVTCYYRGHSHRSSRNFGIRRECSAKVAGQRRTVEVQKLMDPSHRACRREAIRAEVQAIDPPSPVDLPSIFAPSLYLPTFVSSRSPLLPRLHSH